MLIGWLVVSLSANSFSSYWGRAELFDKPEQACTFARGNNGSVLKVSYRKNEVGFVDIIVSVPVECEVTVKTRVRYP